VKLAERLRRTVKARTAYRSVAYRLCVAAAIAFPAKAAVITLQPPEASQGSIAVPIHIAPGAGDQMASLQFDLHFDAAHVEVTSVEAGMCAWQASKDVVFSAMEGGAVRVIVAGMNQYPMEEGIVATVYMQRVGDSSATSIVELDSIVVADPFGNSVETTYENRKIEDAAVIESEFSNSADEKGPEAIPIGETETSAEKSNNSLMRDNHEVWPSGDWTEDFQKSGQDGVNSVLEELSRDLPDDESRRLRANVASVGFESNERWPVPEEPHGRTASSLHTTQRQIRSGPVAASRAFQRNEGPAVFGETVVAEGGTMVQKGHAAERVVTASAWPGIAPSRRVCQDTADRPVGSFPNYHPFGTRILLSLLVFVAVILGILGAVRVFYGRNRKSRAFRLR